MVLFEITLSKELGWPNFYPIHYSIVMNCSEIFTMWGENQGDMT